MNSDSTERFWTIPNVISLYRIFIFPLVLYLIIAGNEKLFSIFITINLISDILDGWIARAFKMQTRIGARLDSWADLGTYLLAFIAVYVFKWNQLQPYSFTLIIFFVIRIISYAIVIIKFRGLIGLHTYLSKFTGYIQGAFIIALFLFNFYLWLYYFALLVGILDCVEEIIIILIISTPMSNVKGLYWILKDKQK